MLSHVGIGARDWARVFVERRAECERFLWRILRGVRDCHLRDDLRSEYHYCLCRSLRCLVAEGRLDGDALRTAAWTASLRALSRIYRRGRGRPGGRGHVGPKGAPVRQLGQRVSLDAIDQGERPGAEPSRLASARELLNWALSQGDESQQTAVAAICLGYTDRDAMKAAGWKRDTFYRRLGALRRAYQRLIGEA